jgi:superfamily I DNA/RNA helicase
MNWALSKLDRFSIVSNSDAHSPDKIGREATILDMEPSFSSLRRALDLPGGIVSTVEFFPQEGKYHFDGHRKCDVRLNPAEAREAGGLCPVCGKALTRGVMSRVMELADRPVDEEAPCPGSAEKTNRRPYHSLIPLREIIAEILGASAESKKTALAYHCLIERAGSEFSILMDRDLKELERFSVPGLSGELLAGALGRMRNGEVSVSAGYDGEYGLIRVFAGTPPWHRGEDLFGDSAAPPAGPDRGAKKSRRPVETPPAAGPPAGGPAPLPPARDRGAGPFVPDALQEEVLASTNNYGLIAAGPGTGKTATLAAKIARLIGGGLEPSSILALSFTVKAAAELGERIAGLLKSGPPDAAGPSGGPVTATFHSFCASVLREESVAAGLDGDFSIVDEEERDEILKILCEKTGGKTKKVRPRRLGLYLEERKRYCLLPGERAFEAAGLPETDPAGYPEPVPELESLYAGYRRLLKERGLLDFDDLVSGAARLFALRAEILAKYRRRFARIFVDEYQDINAAQYALIKFLAPAGSPAGEPATPGLWVIGDPNQAIYGFRGSDNRFIRRFREEYPGAAFFKMIRSFRCAEPIIAAAGQLTGAGLEAVPGGGGTVSLYRTGYPTDKSEAEGIARTISALIGGASFFAKDSVRDNGGESTDTSLDNIGPSDCAVLVRAAALAGPLIKALGDHGIPCEFSGGPRRGAEETEVPDSEVLAALRTQKVRIMTIHASKGLEFDQVFVAGLEEGLLPFTLYDTEEAPCDIEEERRILYVAMTRARRGLRLSWAASRVFNNRKLVSPPSRFLSELERIIPLAASGLRPAARDPQMNLF